MGSCPETRRPVIIVYMDVFVVCVRKTHTRKMAPRFPKHF